MRRIHLAIFLVFSLLMISFVSAGFFSDFFDKITGFASTTGETNVTVIVAGTSVVVVDVLNETITGSDNNPSENSNITIIFFVNVSDADGVDDINVTSVNASFSFFDSSFTEATRTNSSCKHIGNLDANVANFSCSIVMTFFDGDGDWNITVFARSLGPTTFVANTTQIFVYDQLKALVIYPASLTFASVAPGAINATSTNDPTIINNTGNFNVSPGGLTLNATNLIGVTNSSHVIPVANFTVDIVNGGTPPIECVGGTQPVHLTNTVIAGAGLARGNIRVSDNVTGQETIFYCLREVPLTISSQTYSSAFSDGGYGPWTITMT